MKNYRIGSLLLLTILTPACSNAPDSLSIRNTSAAEKDSDDSTIKGDSEDSTTKQKPDPAPPEVIPPVTIPTPPVEEDSKADPKTYFTAIDGFRWEFPCDKDPGTRDECDSKAKTDETKKVGGNAGERYSVEMHFQGVVENMMYKDGKGDSLFYTGGIPNNDTYNIYSIEVSSPKQIYYLNSYPKVGHNTYMIDYKAKINIDAGATIHLVGNGQNGVEISNYKKLVVPGIKPAPAHYNGQFVQMTIVSAEIVKP